MPNKKLRQKIWHNAREIKDIVNEMLEVLEFNYENNKISKNIYINLLSSARCIGDEIYEIELQATNDLRKDKERENNE